MSGGDLREQFLYNLPSSVLWEFCRVMDGLSDLDWTRFASEVLKDQTALRLAERRERRTDSVMNQWGIRNGRVGELIDLLESLQLFRPRDVILGCTPSLNPPPPPLPLPRPPPPDSLPSTVPPSQAPPTVDCSDSKGGGRSLPGPARPPNDLFSEDQQQRQEEQRDDDVIPPDCSAVPCSVIGAVMCWSYEEVHAGTQGFSPALQVGEGGFGVVYRATLSNMDCAVKRIRQDCQIDWSLLRRSFQAEVEKLSKFRHRNIVDLLGFSEGGGTMCLIYRYMDNRSLEDHLHNESMPVSWPDRVSIVEGAAAALQFLHCPPTGQEPLIHGDVKSSNILLDQHLVAKLSDFGLARYAPPGPSGSSATQTASVGKTATVRGTLAYLPDEYVRRGELCTAVDVYSFGVVLLEVLTGHRALERHKKSGEKYLKDLVEDIAAGPSGPTAEAWRNQLDRRLISAGTAEPAGCLEVVVLACRSLHRQRKKRPTMTEVFDKLQNIHSVVRKGASSSSSPLHLSPHPLPPCPSFPRPPRSLDFSVNMVSQQLSKLGPLEPSSSSFCALTPPHPLHSSSFPPLSSCSSFLGPCETDESRGFSQYHLRSNGTSCRSLSPTFRDQNPSPATARPSLPTEDQYSFPPRPIHSGPGVTTGHFGLSPAGSLQSTSPGASVQVNPSKQHLQEKKTQYEEGQIRTPELLSSDDLYTGMSSVSLRGPEESDELDYLPAKHT